MKKMISLALILTFIPVLLSGFIAVANTPVATDIEDNEKGWINEDIRYNAPDVLNNSVFISSSETAAYDADGDGFSLAWNYSMNAAVNAGAFDSLVKNFYAPVVNGTLEFKFWVRNAGGVDPNGLKIEAVAYEANKTAYSLGISSAVLPKTGTPAGVDDTKWYTYHGTMPDGKKIVRMELKLTNGGASATTWGVVNIDGIVFKNAFVGDFTRIEESGWTAVPRTTETPTVMNGTIGYCYEGASAISLTGGVTPDLDYLKSMAMEKTLTISVSGEYLEYKVYMDAFNSSQSTSSKTKTKAIVYESNGTAHELDASASIIRYGAWIGGGMVYGGWNQYRAAIPAGISISKIQIVIFHYQNGGMGGLPYYIDDIKVMNNSYNSGTTNPGDADPQDPNEGAVKRPDTLDFVPDDFTENTGDRVTVNDNELNWYADEVLMNGSLMLDGSRIFDYDPATTNGWQKVENNFVRKDTDDNYAAAFMFKVSHPLADRDYDIIYKDLSVPVKGGKFSFYVWFRNGLPQNHDVFAISAIAYDKNGNAYNLGESEPLSWSGDERYFTNPEDPNVAIMSGWQFYEGIMPKDIEIVKMGVMLLKTDPNSSAVIGPSFTNGFWPGEDWTPIDEIKFTDTILCDDNITSDKATNWQSDQALISPMGEYLNPWCMYSDSTAELDLAFNSMGVDSTNTIYRKFDKGLKGGTFSFKIFNSTNSNLDGEGKYKVSVTAVDKDNNNINLGDITPKDYGNDYLKFSGLPGIAYVYNGYSNLSVALPADKTIKRLEIIITETTGASISSAILMLDDVKYIGTSFVTLNNTNTEAKPSDTATGDTVFLYAEGILFSLLLILIAVRKGQKHHEK